MIISFKHKFIFIKSRKTGGTSAQVALSKICGPEDIITGELVDGSGKVWESYGPGKNIKSSGFFTDNPHPSAIEIKRWIERFTNYKWEDFYKFTIVRNPLELIVSRYHWDISGKGKMKTSIEGFRKWLPGYLNSSYYRDLQTQFAYDDNLNLIVDKVYSHEYYGHMVEELCSKYGLSEKDFGNLKSGHRKKISFWNYYTNVEIESTVGRFADDFEKFTYEALRPPVVSVFNRRRVIQADEANPDLNNINGPSIIKCDNDNLPKYILYFAHHQGTYIRAAVSEDLKEWSYTDEFNAIYNVLDIKDTACGHHIASPDVHYSPEHNIYEMYFHGDKNDAQYSFKAIGQNPMKFAVPKDTPAALGHFYFRVFKWKNRKFALAKKGNECGILYEYIWDIGEYKPVIELIDNMRHCSVHVFGNFLYVFYSLMNDEEEHIRITKILMTDTISEWKVLLDEEVIKPEFEWEGADLVKRISRPGSVYGKTRQLRDPYIFDDGDRMYLFYSYAGENGIAVCDLEFNYH